MRQSAPEASPATPPPANAARNGMLLEVSNAVVKIYKDAFGRGPTKARSEFAGRDVLVVMLENTMTVAERYMAQIGEHERLRQSRLFTQYAMEHVLRGTVEGILGRRTVSFISGIDTERDVSVELFTLEPPSR